MPKEYKDLVVGLDIGTAKIMAVVAEEETRIRRHALRTELLVALFGFVYFLRGYP